VKVVDNIAAANKDAANPVTGLDPEVKATGGLSAVRSAVQGSKVWKMLNYGMNYDIYQV